MRLNRHRLFIPFINRLKNVFFFLGTLLVLVFIIEVLSFSQSASNDDAPLNRNFKALPVPLPDTMSFAGEKVPMNHLGVREGLEQEMLVNTYWQSQSVLMIKRSARYFPVIADILKKNSIPDDFKYLALAESAFSYKVSPAGAVGFWQLMKYTALAYNLEINREVDERYNLEKSTEAACRYFKDAYEEFHNWTLVAASYNMGIEGLRKELEKEKENNYYDLSLNLETSRYVYRILSLKQLVCFPEQYGYFIDKKDMYPPIPSYTVEVDSTITSLADYAAQKGISFHTLKFFNPWLLNDKLSNPQGRTYVITLPRKDIPFAELGETITYSDSIPQPVVVSVVSPPVVDTTEPKIIVHIVEPGETIECIAEKFNVTVDQLRTCNSISDTVVIKPRDELMLFVKHS